MGNAASVRKTFPVVFVLALLVSTVAGAFFIKISEANFFPEPAPSGIKINIDGSVSGTDKISRSGSVYTFTGDINGNIVVLTDGVVLDGAGYSLRGSGSGAGVFLQERNGVTLKNLKIMNFEYGIKFTWANYGGSDASKKVNTVSDNTITNNTYGILLNDFSVGNVFSNNRIMDNTYGVSFSGFSQPSGNVFRNNVFNNNQYGIADGSYRANDVDTSNTVNGKPIYYWVNKHDMAVPADAGYIVLKNCSGITVQNLKLSNNGQGILLCYTTNSRITGNTLTNNIEGITLRESSSNEISKNTITSSRDYGVYLPSHSTDNTIVENNIESSGKDGVHLEFGCPGNTISSNQIAKSQEIGIYLSTSPNSVVIANNLTQNKLTGISLKYDSNNNTIRGNYFSKNGLGLLVETVGSTITENTMINNDGWAIRLNGSQGNNKIHHNNFINNNVSEGLQVSMPAIWSFYALNQDDFLTNHSALKKPSPLKDPTLGPGNPNAWDAGKEGNYWSDYKARYPNDSSKGNVGDTPFIINENNVDNYPLMAPFGSSNTGVSTPAPSPEPQTESQPKPFPTALIAIGSGVLVAAGCIVLISRHKIKQIKIQVYSTLQSIVDSIYKGAIDKKSTRVP